MRAKFVNETLEFERGQDPKEAMGIGMKKAWKKEADKFLASTYGNIERIAEIYFGNNRAQGSAEVLHGFCRKISDNTTPQIAFYEACDNENLYGNRPDIVEERKEIAEVIKKYFNIDVDPYDSRF